MTTPVRLREICLGTSVGPWLRVVVASAVLAVAVACGSAKPPAYPSSTPQSANQTAVAQTERVRPTSAFTSNGCSGFREARFFSCCFVHDLTFWAAGTRSERRRADLDFRLCGLDTTHARVASTGGYFLLWLLYVGNTVTFGLIDDGWGRAWRGTERKKYDALTAAQKEAVALERQRVCADLRLNPKTGRYHVDDSNDPTREIWPQQARQICGGVLPGG